MRTISRWTLGALVLIGVAGAALAALAWYSLLREVPVVHASDEEHFKYGSIGVEAASGMPTRVWRVLPTVFAERFPALAARDARIDHRAAYATFGFLFEDGRDTPIGLPEKTVGFPRLGINCALCHCASIRRSSASTPELVLGAPAVALDLQRYLRFLFDCARDPRFVPARLLAAMEADQPLSARERLVYGWIVIPALRRALLRQQAQLEFLRRPDVPDWGPGRAEGFNPAKVQVLGLPYDGTVGTSDIPPLWNLAARAGASLHWDGVNDSLDEVFLNSAIGNGASADSVDRAGVERLQAWLAGLAPPPYPFAIDEPRAARGALVFERECARCHAPLADRVGRVIALADPRARTDGERLRSFSPAVARAFNALDVYDWRYRGFRPTTGYVAPLLDGLWARAPYLHNGSVPSLVALLAAPELRPREFFRGHDVYDPDVVGFDSRSDAAGRSGWRFDVELRGNGNGGHLFGTELPPAEKADLVEYLKGL